MALHVLDIGSTPTKLSTTDETVVVDEPPAGVQRRTVTRLRFNNHDSVLAMTPKFEVRNRSDQAKNDDREYTRLYVENSIGAVTGEMDDCGSPVYVLGPTESIVCTLDQAPTAEDQAPTVVASWIDQVITS